MFLRLFINSPIKFNKRYFGLCTQNPCFCNLKSKDGELSFDYLFLKSSFIGINKLIC